LPSNVYRRPASVDEALRHLGEPGAVPLGGGTDLLPRLRDDVTHAGPLVDLRRLPGSAEVRELPDGSIHVGASARLAHLARHDLLRDAVPLFAESCRAVGSEALRHMGTLGGNLCQRPRCWYLRRGFPCHKSGGNSCPAAAGENQHHAILAHGPCVAVHPSDPAVALTALGAAVEVVGPAGSRTIAIEHFYDRAAEPGAHETLLAPGEIVTAVRLPKTARGGTQRYEKVMQRGAWDFALVSLAAHQRTSGDVRLVLGGVAPRPWRVGESIEEDVASGGLDDDDIETLATRALYDAVPLAHNAYKVEIAAALLRRGMRALVKR